MNWTVKETLTKLTLETGENWIALLPFALYHVRNTPYVYGLTPFEILFGRSPPSSLSCSLISDLDTHKFFKSIQAFQKVHDPLYPLLRHLYELPPVTLHKYKPGDLIWVNRHQRTMLEPKWKGVHTVLLTTPTAVKVDGIK